MNNKSNTLLIFIGSVGLILIAIVFTSVIDKTKNDSKRTDTRARAGKSGSMVFRGTAGTYDSGTNILTVDRLMFEDSQDKSLGVWSVSTPASFNPAKITPGTRIRITASPVTFQISAKTLTATEIEKQ
jgi:hypothetical protein